MKLSTIANLFLIIIISTYSHFAAAQAQWDGATNSTGMIHRTGNVYIGTSGTSGEKLNVKGNMLFMGNTNYDIKGDVTTGYMTIYPGGGVKQWTLH